MRSRNHFQGALPRRSLRPVVAEAKADGVSGSPHLVTLPTTAQPSVHLARPNPPRINTSVNPSFFIKSLIMNDLKSIRISIADNKSSRINTSSTCSRKPSIINTSKKHPGGWGEARHRPGVSLTAVRRRQARGPGMTPTATTPSGRLALPGKACRLKGGATKPHHSTDAALKGRRYIRRAEANKKSRSLTNVRQRRATGIRDDTHGGEAFSRLACGSLLYFDGFGGCWNAVRETL
jgi:hypothetical protein